MVHCISFKNAILQRYFFIYTELTKTTQTTKFLRVEIVVPNVQGESP